MHKAEEGVAITIFFEEDATQTEISNIKTELEKRDDVKEINYISGDEAWEKFKDEYFGENSDAAEGFANDNPLANSDNYEVYHVGSRIPARSLVEFAEGLPGVREVKKSDMVAKTLIERQ